MGYNGPLPQVVNAGGTGAATLTGLLTGNGTSAVAGTAITQYSVLTAGATNLPNSVAPGPIGTAFISNGPSAQASFQAIPSASGFINQINIQTFLSTGTYTPSPGMLYCIIEAMGGGGAGGGAPTTGATTVSIGGGGGAGEYAIGVFSAATIGASQTVTIGAAGAGASGTTGGNGGNTSVGSIISADGGSGGSFSAAATNGAALGGLGGTGGTGGSVRTPGGAGAYGFAIGTPGNVNTGQGANSQYGAGGISLIGAGTGSAALGFGAGGAGAGNYTNGSAQTGGAGSQGVVIITEYIDFVPVSPSLLIGSLGVSNLAYLKSNGTAWSAGDGRDGQIGNNTVNSYSSPVSVLGNQTYIGIATANFATVALRNDGTVWGWGNNSTGNLGNNTTTSYSSPISVVGGFSFTQISSAYSGFDNFCAALDSQGHCWMWGDNTYGQLGNNTTTSYSSPISVVGGHSFTQVLCGFGFMLALKANGQLWVWGSNSNGQLGQQNRTSYSSPVSVVGGFNFTQMAAGSAASYALDTNGNMWAWGDNTFGELGQQNHTSYSSPVSVVGGFSFVQIQASDYTTFGLRANGDMWAWGNNQAGQLGNNTVTGASSPISVIGNFSFVKLVTQDQAPTNVTSAAWLSNGQMWAWGYNLFGQIGNNTRTSYSSPVLVLNTP